MQYRRIHIAGGTYFFTVNLQSRSSHLLTQQIEALRHAVLSVKQRHPFHIDAWVVLPDHLHALWTLPPGDVDYSTRWALIKANFSRLIAHGEPVAASRLRKGERGIWQRRFWEHRIRDDDDFARHVDYIHINPVKHGYTLRANDWPYSSIHRYIRDGMLGVDWACAPGLEISGGERGW
jgi:putative transposase